MAARYNVLRSCKFSTPVEEQDGTVVYGFEEGFQVVAVNVEAHSAEQACRKVAADLDVNGDIEGVTLVAVARWEPVTFHVEVKRQLRIDTATAGKPKRTRRTKAAADDGASAS